MAHVLVMGDGSWGTAFALLLLSKNHRVALWSYFPEQANTIRRENENKKFLPGIEIPDSISILHRELTVDFHQFDLIVNAVPTQFVRPVFHSVFSQTNSIIPILSLSKGLEISTRLRVSQILHQITPKSPVLALSGPSHAEEVAQKLPTAVTLAGKNYALLEYWQNEISTDYFRIYTNSDLIGVEMAGALKNVIGLAAGMVDGLGFGDNTKSALITRGLAEITRLTLNMGAQQETLYGLSGLGDLITTSISRHGRNWKAGFIIGQGTKFQEYEKQTAMVIEGAYTVKAAIQLAKEYSIEMPITEQIYQVIYENLSPRDAVLNLMTRAYKSERFLAGG